MTMTVAVHYVLWNSLFVHMTDGDRVIGESMSCQQQQFTQMKKKH